MTDLRCTPPLRAFSAASLSSACQLCKICAASHQGPRSLNEAHSELSGVQQTMCFLLCSGGTQRLQLHPASWWQMMINFWKLQAGPS